MSVFPLNHNRTAQLLPVPYYLDTFTVPEALRKIVRANQRACYQAMFDAGSQTIRELASGPRFIGTDRLGCFGALHKRAEPEPITRPPVRCAECRGEMQLVAITDGIRRGKL